MSRLARPLLIAVAFLGVLTFGIWLGGHPSGLPEGVSKHLVDKQTRLFDEALDTVHDTYYVKPERQALGDNAIKGMVAYLDDQYSNYFTPKEYKEFNRHQRSEFPGIGVLVSADKLGLRVIRVYDDSPARRGGVKARDIIVKADKHVLKGLSQDRASSFIKGPPGTKVDITVRRKGKDILLHLSRATVSAGFTESKLIDDDGDKVGVVNLSQFGPGAHADLIQALRKLKAKGATRYVLDLRGNPGGLVTEARLVASIFIEQGKIVTTRGRAVPAHTLDATGDALLPKAPLVVLVDRDSASAAEIVTGALQDHKRAEIVGTRTYGKGIFQEVIELSNGGALDITAGQYFLPSGRNIGGKGVRPGQGIQPDVKAQDDPKTKNTDEALDKAVAVVEKAPATA